MKYIFTLIFLSAYFAAGAQTGHRTQDEKTTNPEWNDPVIRRLYSADGPYRNYPPEKEIISLRTETAKIFANDDGTRTSLITAGPLHYTENGILRTSSNEIIAYTNSALPQVQFANVHNKTKTYYGPLGTGVSAYENGTAVLKNYRPGGIFLFDSTGNEIKNVQEYNMTVIPENVPEVYNGILQYRDIAPGVDFRVMQLTSKIKSEYEIRSAAMFAGIAPDRFIGFAEVFEFNEDVRISFSEDNGTIHFTNNSGVELLSYGNGKYFEKNRMSSSVFEKIEFRVKEIHPKIYEVSLLIPVAWLLDPVRNYPVIIDPTATFYPSNASFWTGFTNNAGDSYGDNNMKVGFYDCPGCTDQEWVTYVKFELSSIPDNACTIDNAALSVYQHTWRNNNGNDGLIFDVGWANVEPVAATWPTNASAINGMTERYATWSVWNTPGACSGCNGGYDYPESPNNVWKNLNVDYALTRTRVLNRLASNYMTIGFDLTNHAADCGTCFFDETNELEFRGYSDANRPQFVITYDVPYVAATSVSGTTAICPGGSTTLTRVGGTTGTGGAWRWYTGSCGGTLAGIGDNITVTPGATTTYYLRGEGDCGNTACISVTVTISTVSVAPATISGTTTICNGNNTTLTVSGGTMGTGAAAQWFTGSCGGSGVGTGTNVVVAPGSTTTYYVRYAGNCNTTACISQTVTVNTLSTAPTSITGTNSVCVGNSTTLTLSGGSAGTGAAPQWFAGSCSGTVLGTGTSLVVAPAANTTYYVRYNGTCNITGCASQLVSVTAPSTTGLTTGDFVWRGASSTAWGTNNNWLQWNGSTFVVASTSPGPANDVFIEPTGTCVSNNSVAAATDILSLTIRTGGILQGGTALINIRTSFTNNGTFTPTLGTVQFSSGSGGSIGGTGIFDFYDLVFQQSAGVTTTLNNNIRVRNSLTMNGGDLNTGTNRVEVGMNATVPGSVSWSTGTIIGNVKKWISAATGNYVLPVGNSVSGTVYNRWAQLNFTGAPSSGGSLTARFTGTAAPMYTGLPLLDGSQIIQDFANEGYWEITPGDGLTGGTYTLTLRGNNFTTINTLSTLRIIKSPNTHTTWTLDGTHAGVTGTLTDPVVSRTGMSGFSWFTIGSPNSNPLPVKLASFEASCINGKMQLDWATASEENNEYFSIEKSADGNIWYETARMNGAGNSNTLLNYSWTDENTLTGTFYYRLTQVDYNGAHETFDPVSSACASFGNNTVLLYPNPAKQETDLVISLKQAYGKGTIRISDLLGKIVKEQVIYLQQGENKFRIEELNALTPGTYHITILSEDLTLPVQKLVIQR